MKKARRRSAISLITSMVILIGSACSASNSSDDPYAPELKSAQKQATSAFEKDVFADLVITKSEFDEAVERYVACAQDRGTKIKAVPVAGGYYNYDLVKSGEAETVAEECRKGTIALVEPIYVDRLMNPEKKNIDQLLADCLVRSGVAPEGYSAEQFVIDRAKNFAETSFGPDNPAVPACLSNPSNGL
ncbi:hypothetical protein [Micromonospora inaquosa]|uniref:hypothetical protein n=1 Tax=Micromonospora inaquosa TaxID=2203716 RepID=UPI000F5DD16E|nr:hypothetical protein [Micromonospora inaquosa]